MSYRKILVPLTGSRGDNAALDAALLLARQFAAHVEALFIRIDPVRSMPYGYVAGDVSGYATQYAIEAAIRAADAALKQARASFDAATERAGVGLNEKPGVRDGATAHLRVVQGVFEEEVERASRLVDLVVFCLLRGDEGQDSEREGLEAALLSGTRPVLLVNESPADTLGRRIAIAYDGSATAAHAVTAAMPLILQASSVHSFEVTDATGVSGPLAELRDYLVLRGIVPSEHLVDPGLRSVAETLATAVAEQACDLLVLGGYGHSRLREFVLGGVTRHVVRHGVPFAVLLAH